MDNKINELTLNRKEHYNELINYMPYKDKVYWAKTKIKEFLLHCMELNKQNTLNKIDEITVSFSGGKDSTVLLDLVLKVHEEIECDIYLVPAYAVEITFPSTIKFIKMLVIEYQKKYKYLKNPLLMNPKLPWHEILNTKGYPIYSKQISVLINRVKHAKTKNLLTRWFFGIDIKNTNTAKYKLSKHRIFLLDDDLKINWPELTDNQMKDYFKKYNEYYFYSEKCCDYVKGSLKHDRRPSFIGVMAEESEMRKKSWINSGCNIFNSKSMKSRPLSIWKTKDIWKYIVDNKLMINPAYGYDEETSPDQQKLNFNRLGCTSCPYGSSIEAKKIEYLTKKNNIDINDNRLKNRFEILKDLYPTLYLSQVIHTGMYRIIIDMGVKINNDEIYMKLFNLRQIQIQEWYSLNNFRNNILRLLAQIENYNDYKNKGPAHTWSYSIVEINQALTYFSIDHKINLSEFNKIRNKIKNDFKKRLNSI